MLDTLLRNFGEDLQSDLLTQATVGFTVLVLLAALFYLVASPRQFLLVLKNLRRNSVRTILTGVAVAVLSFMVVMIWTVLTFLDRQTREKARDLKIIITERWQIPSQLPMTHARYLAPVLRKFDGTSEPNPDYIFKDIPDLRDKIGPDDFMTWSFFGGTTDPTKMSRENIVFFFVMEPRAIRPMMDDMEDFPKELVDKLARTRNGCLLGKERLQNLNKKVGERFELTSLNYKGIKLDFEIVGELPEGRYNTSGIMNLAYFNEAMERYRQETGTAHPLDQKRLNLIWMRVPDKETFNKVSDYIENGVPIDPAGPDDPSNRRQVFADRPVKCETQSSGIGSFLDAYRDLIAGVRYLLVPVLLATMALVLANAISISVRERRAEMAVMKVLGFRPRQILCMVLGESVLVGACAGILAALMTFLGFNLSGGLPFQIGFFPSFLVPLGSLFWGCAIGAATGLLGSFFPAWNARSVKVSEVFSKVA